MLTAGPLVRARWTKIYQGTDKLRIAYGFESATIETVEIAGPILVTALVTGIGPLAGLAAVLACALGDPPALAAHAAPSPIRHAAGGEVGNSLRIPALQGAVRGAVMRRRRVRRHARIAHRVRDRPPWSRVQRLVSRTVGCDQLLRRARLRRVARADAAASVG